MNGLRVLMISGDSSVFDQSSALYRRARLYAQKLEHLDVLAPANAQAALHEEGNLSLHPIHGLSILRFFSMMTRGETLQKPNLVTAQDPFFLGLVALCIARHHKVPLELQVHTDVLDPYFRTWSMGNRIRVAIARALLPQADTVRVVSDRIAQSLIARKLVTRKQVAVLPIASPLEKPNPEAVRALRSRFSSHDRLILTVARLSKEKRIHLMLESLAIAHQNGFSFQFIIIGEGVERGALERLASRLGISDKVHFIGYVTDPSPYYAIADCYLCLSAYEGFGLSLVEAAHAHVPIISTDVGVAQMLGARLVPPVPSKVAELITQRALAQSALPHDFIRSEDEYVHAVVNEWSRCAHIDRIAKGETSRIWLLTKYIISGGTATVVDLGLLYVFTALFGIWYVISAILAYACAFIVSFTLQKFWTFRNGTMQHIRKQFALYVSLGVFNMFLNASLLYLIVENTRVHYLSAQFSVGILIALWSFFCYRILFKDQAV